MAYRGLIAGGSRTQIYSGTQVTQQSINKDLHAGKNGYSLRLNKHEGVLLQLCVFFSSCRSREISRPISDYKIRRHTDPNGRYDQNEIKRNKRLNYFRHNIMFKII